ncbi:MAG TPA: heparin lyase I family protein [Ardenticatenaceae bacterium]|nr:heparin lyase I family protein [Ardenticatenaceae bacterium]
MRDWWHPEPAGREGNNCGGEYNSGGGATGPADSPARAGRYAAFLQTGDIGSSQQGARLFRWCEPRANDALYYSAWYLIPTRVTVESWWAIMQWKSAGSFNPKFALMVGNRPDGEMYLYLGRGRDSGGGSWSQSTSDLPVGQWFHLEAYYEKAGDGTGRVTVWQDGVELLDLAGVSTANGEDLGWSVINYGDSLDPGNLTIYTDDAAISRTRLGP